MRKILMIVAVMVGMVFFSAQAEVNKEELFASMTQKYSGLDSVSGKYVINTPMMDDIMKMPVDFWEKDDKMRMDMTMVMEAPEIPLPMTQMLFDGQKMIFYDKILNTVMTFDLNKIPEPENIKPRMGKGMVTDINLSKLVEKSTVEEKSRDGKKFYLITVADITDTDIGNIYPGMGMPGKKMFKKMFKKVVLWINQSSLLPEKIEFYGKKDTPSMWIDILEIKTDIIPDSIFKLDIPRDAKYMDMTESLKKMSELMKRD
ncbi:MAG: hypothetical protein NC832_00450 [Candidatus Omnitrophica bacterium]|nr:hypothetical protein [Candidatus Omnitrophota bacterium]